MKPFRSRCLALASVLAAGAALSAARPQYGGTLRAEVDTPVSSLDPASAPSEPGQETTRTRLATLLFESLTAIEPDGLRPVLATSWQADVRGTHWRFRLRSGVVLHDRTTLEPWQAAAAIRHSEPAWTVNPDGDSIAIDTGEPVADLPWLLADGRHAIVIRAAGGALIGSGPFRIDHVEPSRLLLKAHEGYWRARPFVDAVQIELGRKLDMQLTDLEGGRTDIVNVRATDVRRLTRRGLRVEASRPLELVALIFEPHRAADSAIAWRRALAATINRDAIGAVVLQGQAAPARAILPEWISGYTQVVAPAEGPTLAAPAIAALPIDQRTVLLRVDPADAVTQAIADRLAVDAREAGFTVKVQAPVGLAPRADARLIRLAVPATTADRAFAETAARLTVRGWPAITLPGGTTLDATYRAEQTLLDRLIVVPIVHLPELYGVSERVGSSLYPAARAIGGWDLADLWLQGGRP
ncbi:MAG TPA: ABC transporter substrate-binding protein [Vicinamibacterales bacterium]|nr:ABC transporter substrate-binding protein [Vicinamibacterales bacterium]